MIELSIFTIGCLIVSILFDLKKTMKGIKGGLAMFIKLLPVLLFMLALVSIVLFLIPEKTLIRFMGNDAGFTGWLIAGMLGSVALIPGFIAYPLCGILIKSGVSYGIIAVFITTLMMVGIITLPIEAKFFGWKISILRNVLSFIGALLVGFLMKLFL
jgi:uncharacterized membrane protein YraQ (UPF0718 family)